MFCLHNYYSTSNTITFVSASKASQFIIHPAIPISLASNILAPDTTMSMQKCNTDHPNVSQTTTVTARVECLSISGAPHWGYLGLSVDAAGLIDGQIDVPIKPDSRAMINLEADGQGVMCLCVCQVYNQTNCCWPSSGISRLGMINVVNSPESCEQATT